MTLELTFTLPALVFLLLALVLGIADHTTRKCSRTGSDGSAFKATTGLMADDSADGCSTEAAKGGAGLCVRSAGDAGKKRACCYNCKDSFFHSLFVPSRCRLLIGWFNGICRGVVLICGSFDESQRQFIQTSTRSLEPNYQILLYYLYREIADPEAFAATHRDLCERLELKGRILIAKEGINGTVSGTIAATTGYMEAMSDDPITLGTEFKVDPAEDHAFPKLSIKVRPEVVSLGLEMQDEEDIDPRQPTGVRLDPKDWAEAMEAGDAVILDGRNNYESALGHFSGAVCPDVENFRDFPRWIRDNMGHLKNRKILTYCTGGIRCEKLSGFLLREGFRDVAQLHGGILNYGQHPDTKGRHFDGQCYVFDQRVRVEVNRTETSTIISRCVHCSNPSDRYINCRYTSCNDQVFCCESCEKNEGRFCSSDCRAAAERTGASRPV